MNPQRPPSASDVFLVGCGMVLAALATLFIISIFVVACAMV